MKRNRYRFSTRACVELCEDSGDVMIDRSGGDEQMLSNLSVAEPVNYSGENLRLANCETGRIIFYAWSWATRKAAHAGGAQGVVHHLCRRNRTQFSRISSALRCEKFHTSPIHNVLSQVGRRHLKRRGKNTWFRGISHPVLRLLPKIRRWQGRAMISRRDNGAMAWADVARCSQLC